MFVSAYSAQYSSYTAIAAGRNLAGGSDENSANGKFEPVLGAYVSISQGSYTLLQASSDSSGAGGKGVTDSATTETAGVGVIPGASERIAATAGAIVDFIALRLAQDVADGATQEELQSRLQAGLDGFLSGYGDAAQQLEGLGQLSPDIAAEIQGTFDKVIEGIDKLSQQYLDEGSRLDLSSYQNTAPQAGSEQSSGLAVNTTPFTPVTTSPALIYDQSTLKAQAQLNVLNSLQVVADVQRQIAEKAAQKTAKDNGSYDGLHNKNESSTSDANDLSAKNVWAKFGYQELQTRNFSFKLTTDEGDVVTINAAAASAFSAQEKYQNNGSVNLQYREASAQTDQFAFSVKGELNADELEAINNLLVDITDLAAVFYQGDVQGAFEQALSLGYDDQQIASFS